MDFAITQRTFPRRHAERMVGRGLVRMDRDCDNELRRPWVEEPRSRRAHCWGPASVTVSSSSAESRPFRRDGMVELSSSIPPYVPSTQYKPLAMKLRAYHQPRPMAVGVAKHTIKHLAPSSVDKVLYHQVGKVGKTFMTYAEAASGVKRYQLAVRTDNSHRLPFQGPTISRTVSLTW